MKPIKGIVFYLKESFKKEIKRRGITIKKNSSLRGEFNYVLARVKHINSTNGCFELIRTENQLTIFPFKITIFIDDDPKKMLIVRNYGFTIILDGKVKYDSPISHLTPELDLTPWN